jgi:fructuronate reductase
MRYLRGADEQGQIYTIHDPMAEPLHALALAHAGNASATVQALGTLAAIWGEALPQDARWLARVSHWLEQITQRSILSALAQLNDAASPTSV